MAKYIAELNYGDRLNTAFRNSTYRFEKGKKVEITQEEYDELSKNVITVSGRPYNFKTSFEVSKFKFTKIEESINTEPKKEAEDNTDGTITTEKPKSKKKKKGKKKKSNEVSNNQQNTGESSKPEKA